MRDDFHNLKHKVGLAPTSISSDTTTNGAEIDRDSAMTLTAFMLVGGYSGGDFEMKVMHADDDGTGNPDSFSEVPDSDLIGTEAGSNLDGNGVSKIGYTGGKAFVRVDVVSANGANGTVGVTVVEGGLYHAPDDTQAR